MLVSAHPVSCNVIEPPKSFVHRTALQASNFIHHASTKLHKLNQITPSRKAPRKKRGRHPMSDNVSNATKSDPACPANDEMYASCDASTSENSHHVTHQHPKPAAAISNNGPATAIKINNNPKKKLVRSNSTLSLYSISGTIDVPENEAILTSLGVIVYGMIQNTGSGGNSAGDIFFCPSNTSDVDSQRYSAIPKEVIPTRTVVARVSRLRACLAYTDAPPRIPSVLEKLEQAAFGGIANRPEDVGRCASHELRFPAAVDNGAAPLHPVHRN